MTDPASFRNGDVEAVYHGRALCPLTLHWQFVDPHHILGRGEDFGIKKDDPRRYLLSSILNFAPLQRDVHKGPRRDHPYMRALLLEAAAKKVQEAIVKGYYALTVLDRDFLSLADEWKKRNNL